MPLRVVHAARNPEFERDVSGHLFLAELEVGVVGVHVGTRVLLILDSHAQSVVVGVPFLRFEARTLPLGLLQPLHCDAAKALLRPLLLRFHLLLS